MNNDGLPDIIPGYPDDKVDGLYWYENPTWEKHLISAELADMMLWITARDLDSDGIPELAVAGGHLESPCARYLAFKSPY